MVPLKHCEVWKSSTAHFKHDVRHSEEWSVRTELGVVHQHMNLAVNSSKLAIFHLSVEVHVAGSCSRPQFSFTSISSSKKYASGQENGRRKCMFLLQNELDFTSIRRKKPKCVLYFFFCTFARSGSHWQRLLNRDILPYQTEPTVIGWTSTFANVGECSEGWVSLSDRWSSSSSHEVDNVAPKHYINPLFDHSFPHQLHLQD